MPFVAVVERVPVLRLLASVVGTGRGLAWAWPVVAPPHCSVNGCCWICGGPEATAAIAAAADRYD